MNPYLPNESATPNGDADVAEHAPVVPSERDAWIGMAATLLLCLVVAVVYFWASGAHGR